MPSTEELLIAYLAQNIPSSQAAAAVGISESRVSQLLNDPDFAQKLEAQKVAISSKDVSFDDNLDTVEETLLENVLKRAPFMDAKASLLGLRVVSGISRRRDRRVNPPERIGTVVNIMLPAALTPHYVMNGQSEIVEVEGRTMIAATPDKVDALVRTANPQLATSIATRTVEQAQALVHPSQRRQLASRNPAQPNGPLLNVNADLA